MYLPFSSVNPRVIIAKKSVITHIKMARLLIAGKIIGKKLRGPDLEIKIKNALNNEGEE